MKQTLGCQSNINLPDSDIAMGVRRKKIAGGGEGDDMEIAVGEGVIHLPFFGKKLVSRSALFI